MSKTDEDRRITLIIGISALAALLLFLILCQIIHFFWVRIESKRVGPIKKTPIIPFSLHNLNRVGDPEGIRFLCGRIYNYNVGSLSGIIHTRSFLKELRKLLALDPDTYIPNDCRVISIKMDGFDYGQACHEFKPSDGEAPGSHYTWQMYGDNKIQVTYYVKDGYSYIAGFCLYIPEGKAFRPKIASYSAKVIKKIMNYPGYEPAQPPPIRGPDGVPHQFLTVNNGTVTRKVLEEGVTPVFLHDAVPNEKWIVEYCENLTRHIMTTKLDGSVYHKEWSVELDRMKSYKCDSCTMTMDAPPSYDSIALV